MKATIINIFFKSCYYTGKTMGKIINFILPNKIKNLILKNS